MLKTEKPWGYEILLGRKQGSYLLKLISLNKGCSTSVHYHEQKQETLYIVSGEITLDIDGTKLVLMAGNFITIAPNSVHRMTANEDALYIEGSSDHLEDVIRLIDNYGRL